MKRFFINFNAFVLLLSLFISPIWAKDLYVGGQSVGIVLAYDGVYVSGTYPINIESSVYDPQKDSNILSGDFIMKADDVAVDSVQDLYVVLKEAVSADDDSVSLTLKRNDEMILRELKMSNNNGMLSCGLYVKDNATGIGTLTFINPENQTFGALGHDIVDSTNTLLDNGQLFKTSISGIKKTSKASIGEKIASADSFEYLGDVNMNNIYGIYGMYEENLNGYELMEMASQEEVHVGPAKIRTVLQNNQVQEFDIEITKTTKQMLMDKKGLQFRIVDNDLIVQTGGIIQGMSGSPIIQDGKIIGAVTHVVVNNPLNGYGIYIEFMVENGNKSLKR